MTWRSGYILLAATVLSCGPTFNRVGIPSWAVAVTYCDQATGLVRTVIDAEVLDQSNRDEVLVHERVHREQFARRPGVGPHGCPAPFTIFELLDVEVEAYCVSFDIAVKAGTPPAEVGNRYRSILRFQFDELPEVRALVDAAWEHGCPGHRDWR